MEKDIAQKDILVAFAKYGFRKATMDDLARAAGVSRQTLYKRFDSKQALLDWAVAGFVDARYGHGLEILNDPDGTVHQTLLRFYMAWMGELVPMLHSTPHGAEIMDMSTDSLESAGVDTHLDFEDAVATYLVIQGLCPNRARAEEIYLLLTMAAKGLLFKGRTEADFEAGMTRIIKTVFPAD